MKLFKRIISGLLTIGMLATLIPAGTAFADDTTIEWTGSWKRATNSITTDSATEGVTAASIGGGWQMSLTFSDDIVAQIGNMTTPCFIVTLAGSAKAQVWEGSGTSGTKVSTGASSGAPISILDKTVSVYTFSATTTDTITNIKIYDAATAEKFESTLAVTVADIYTGQTPAPKVTTNTSGAEVTYKYTYGGAETTTFDTVGEYTLTASTPETDFYKSASCQVTFNVLKRPKSENIEIKFTDESKLKAYSESNKFKCAVGGSWASQKIIDSDSLNHIQSGLAAMNDITFEVEVTGEVASEFELYIGYADNKNNAYWGKTNSSSKNMSCESAVITEPGTYTIKLSFDSTADPTSLSYLGLESETASCYTNNPDAVVTIKSAIINKATVVKTYTVSSTITGTLYSDGTLVVSGKGSIPAYKASTQPWYSERDSITAIVVEEGITLIGNYAFYYASNVETIDIASTVTQINAYAFNYCGTSDAVADIKGTITSASSGCFSSFTGIIKVYDDTTFTNIKSRAPSAIMMYMGELAASGEAGTSSTFTWNADTKTLTISGTGEITTDFAKYGAFVETLVIEEGITKVNANFDRFVYMKSAVVPSTVTEIGNTFQYATNPELVIEFKPAAPTSIGSSIFYTVKGTVNVYSEDAYNTIMTTSYNYATIVYKGEIPASGAAGDSATFKWDNETKTLTISGTGTITKKFFVFADIAENIVIESGITGINSGIFTTKFSSTKKVTVPATVSTIGCLNLINPDVVIDIYSTELTVSSWGVLDSVTGTINVYEAAPYVAVVKAAKSANVVFKGTTPTTGPAGDTSTWTWDEASKTLTFTGTGTITKYDVYTQFYGETCEKAVVSEGIEGVGSNTLNNLKAVKSITVAKTVSNFQSSSMSYMTANEDLVIDIYSTKITSTGSFMYGTKATVNIYEPDAYNFILAVETSGTCTFVYKGIKPTTGAAGDNATWKYDSSTKTLTISGTGDLYSKYNLAFRAFYGTEIENVVIESGITSIYEYSFEKMDAMKSLKLAGTIKKIGSYAFQSCTALDSLVIPDGVEEIGSSAFYRSGIRSITFPTTSIKIGAEAFNYTSLESLTIPSNVTLARTCFASCTSLKEVTLEKPTFTLTSGLGSDYFRGCSALAKVSIKGDYTTLPNRLFNNLSDTGCLKDIYIYSKGITSFKKWVNATGDGTFDTRNSPIFHIYEGSTTEKSLKTASYIADGGTNFVYIIDQSSVLLEVDKAVAAADALTESDYTEASWKALQDAIAKKDTITETMSVEDILKIVDAINTAIDELVPADSTADALAEFTEVYEKAAALIQTDYSKDTWTPFAEALETAKAIVDKGDKAVISEISASKAALEETMAALEVDYSAMLDPALAYVVYGGTEAAIYNDTVTYDEEGATSIRLTFDCAPDVSFNPNASIEVKALVNGTENYQKFMGTGNYTSGTTDCQVTLPITSALKEGDSVIVTATTYSWSGAKEGYVYKMLKVEFLDDSDEVISTYEKEIGTPTGELEELVELAEILDEIIIPEDYTTESYEEFTEAYETAKNILAEEKPLPSAITASVAALEKAVSGLTLLDTTAAAAKLSQDIKNAEALKSDDYTQDSWAAFQEAFELIKEDAEYAVSMSEINSVSSRLADALALLVKKPTSSVTASSTSKSTDESAVKAPKVAKVKKVKAVSKKKKTVKVTWKKIKGVKGYKIQVSKKKNFKAKNLLVKKTLKKNSKKIIINAKKLKSGKKYFVRVRAYKTYTDSNGKLQKAWGSWSAKKPVKVK